jgi:hypothetical protein
MTKGSIFDNCVTGRADAVVTTVVRKLSAHTREAQVRWFKIGVTSNPATRFGRYKRQYDEMILVYKTISLNWVRDLEAELIDHNWEIADNFIGGGGGRMGRPPYFVYVVVKYW